jgi:integrase
MPRPKKSSRFQVKKYQNPSGTASYRVEGVKPNGARVRRNFATRLEAEQERADLEAAAAGLPIRSPLKRTLLSDEQLTDAEAAVRSAGNRKLATLVTRYIAIEERLQQRGISIEAAVSFAEKHFREEIASISTFNAREQFLESRSGTEKRTRRFYESALKSLLKPDPNRHLHTVTVADLEKILAGYKNVNSRRAYRAAFGVFFNWAVRHHYCLENPCKRLDKLPKDMSLIAALSLEECKRLLYASMLQQDGSAAATVAIGLFAGLRPSEIRDLKAEDILKEKIRVSGGKLRRQLKRSVPIPPVLAAWLKKYPFKGLPTGWDSKLKALKKSTKAKKWVQDIIRHTSITFQTERDKNEALTAYNCGTSIQMMNRHYRDNIDDEKTIDEFWALTPQKLMAKKPEIELPGKPRNAWPDKKALARLVWEKPLIHAAKDLGVSDVALRKHCVKAGIELPKQGHWARQQQLAGKK